MFRTTAGSCCPPDGGAPVTPKLRQLRHQVKKSSLKATQPMPSAGCSWYGTSFRGHLMSDLAKTTVLVVDDELLVGMDLALNLELVGYRTYQAGNAADALEVLEKHPEIRIVFTDIQMPGSMDGIALSHYIRKRWPPTILVICSGNRTPRSSEMPSDTDFLPKPVCKGTLDRFL